jgi:hypothetical protein
MKTLSFFALLGIFGASLESHAASSVIEQAAKIDALLSQDWEKNKVKGNPMADETTYVRRLYLDIIGRIPTADEAQTFYDSKDPNKRVKLVEQLLSSEAHAKHAFNYWADVLRVQHNGQTRIVAGTAYVEYLKRVLQENKPYDELVRELITADGKAWENGAIGYYMRDRGMPLDNMATTTRVFLGTRIECAQCHNHPFDKWTQMEFFQMGAFSYGSNTNDYYGPSMNEMRSMLSKEERELRDLTRSKDPKIAAKASKGYEKLRRQNSYVTRALADIRGSIQYTEVTHYEKDLRLPHDYQYDDAKPKAVVEAATMMGHAAEPKPGETRLQAYARWMTSPENPRFTTVVVNRLWKRAFGLALIEPLDELMDTSVPMNKDLLKYLEQLMVDLKYDMRAFQAVIYNTKAYQREVTRDEIGPGDVYRFTGPLLRRMTPEQMWDSFVTLINPSPDMTDPVQEQRAESRLLASKKLRDALDALTPEELLEGGLQAAKSYEKRSAETQAIQKKMAIAREAKDKDKLKELSRELSRIQSENRKVVDANIVVPGMLKLAAKAGVTEVAFKPEVAGKLAASGDASEMMGSMMMSEMMGSVESSSKILIPGYDPKIDSKEREKALREAQEKAWTAEAKAFGIPENELKDYLKSRSKQVTTWLRATELESPAPRGHFLREFGQSDREVIENANLDASVPQALALMNGQLLPSILHPHSRLMLALRKAEYEDDKVEAAFLSILSRKPSVREKEVWAAAGGKGLESIEDLIYALLNTQQFIFIQ